MPAKKTVADNLYSESALDMMAQRFRSLGEATRLKLVTKMMDGEMTVGQLVEATGSGQANVSKHLSILKEAGMIETRKEGLSTYCSIATPMVQDMCDQVLARLRADIAETSKSLRV